MPNRRFRMSFEYLRVLIWERARHSNKLHIFAVL
jgi:hypothetical protein